MWTKIFKYKDGKGIFNKLHYMFCYAGFLWNANDTQLAILQEYNRQYDSFQSLEKAYDQIEREQLQTIRDNLISRDNIAARTTNEFNLASNIVKQQYINEIREEDIRWEQRGISLEERERRRAPSSATNWVPDRAEFLNEPVVYEKMIDADNEIYYVVHDKIAGTYTAYVMFPLAENLDKISIYHAVHVKEFDNVLKSAINFAKRKMEHFNIHKRQLEEKKNRTIRIPEQSYEVFREIEQHRIERANRVMNMPQRTVVASNTDGGVRPFTVLSNASQSSSQSSPRNNSRRRNRTVDIDHVRAAMGQADNNDLGLDENLF